MRIKREIEKILNYAKKDKSVVAVFIFGSFARGEKYRDVDICIVLKNKLSNLEMSRKRLEYLTISPALDIHVFQQLPIYIKIRILKEGKCILCKDENFLYDLVFETIRKFEDFRPYYKAYLEGVLNG